MKGRRTCEETRVGAIEVALETVGGGDDTGFGGNGGRSTSRGNGDGECDAGERNGGGREGGETEDGALDCVTGRGLDGLGLA